MKKSSKFDKTLDQLSEIRSSKRPKTELADEVSPNISPNKQNENSPPNKLKSVAAKKSDTNDKVIKESPLKKDKRPKELETYKIPKLQKGKEDDTNIKREKFSKDEEDSASTKKEKANQGKEEITSVKKEKANQGKEETKSIKKEKADQGKEETKSVKKEKANQGNEETKSVKKELEAKKANHTPSKDSRKKSLDDSALSTPKSEKSKPAKSTPTPNKKDGEVDASQSMEETLDQFAEKKKQKALAYKSFLSRAGPKNPGSKIVPEVIILFLYQHK